MLEAKINNTQASYVYFFSFQAQNITFVIHTALKYKEVNIVHGEGDLENN